MDKRQGKDAGQNDLSLLGLLAVDDTRDAKAKAESARIAARSAKARKAAQAGAAKRRAARRHRRWPRRLRRRRPSRRGSAAAQAQDTGLTTQLVKHGLGAYAEAFDELGVKKPHRKRVLLGFRMLKA